MLTELQSLPHVEATGWRIVNNVRIEGRGISIELIPDNGEWRRSLKHKELFVRVNLNAVAGDRLSLDPTKVFLVYREQIYKPTVFLCNRETDQQFRPVPRIVRTEPINISEKVACAFLKYDILPPDTKEEFVLQVEGVTQEDIAIKVPPIRFSEGVMKHAGRMF